MSEVYQINENRLGCFTNGLNYTGFLNGSETQLNLEPVELHGGTLTPGDKIIGFYSGNSRTSFLLEYDYMVYRGRLTEELYFEIYDSKSNAKQGNLFEQRPEWYLTFHMAQSDCLLMFSQPSACWDIRPYKIVRYPKQAV